MFHLGSIALLKRDLPRARNWFKESLRFMPGYSATLNLQGTLACYEKDYEHAMALCSQALVLFQKDRWSHGNATGLHSMGDIALFQGDLQQSRQRFRESLRLFSENGNRQRAVWCLGGLAAVAAADDLAMQAMTIWTAAQAIHTAIGSPCPALRIDDYRTRVDAVHDRLDPGELAAAVSAGRSMTFEQAVAYALAA